MRWGAVVVSVDLGDAAPFGEREMRDVTPRDERPEQVTEAAPRLEESRNGE